MLSQFYKKIHKHIVCVIVLETLILLKTWNVEIRNSMDKFGFVKMLNRYKCRG